MNADAVKCNRCAEETNKLALFPGGICLKCYEQTPAARAPMTAADIANAFRKAVPR